MGNMGNVKDAFSAYSHLGGLVLALFGAGWLVGRAHDGGAALATFATYGVCLVALYLASTLYHLIPAGARLGRALRTIDRAAIYLVIAGTCTPIFHRSFTGGVRIAMLSGIWSAAALGIVLKVFFLRAPRALTTAIYVAMGWAVVLRWQDVAHALPREVVALIVAGGVVYTAGAVVYALKRPDPFPRVFGFHEIWHLFVLGGSVLHWSAIAMLS